MEVIELHAAKCVYKNILKKKKKGKKGQTVRVIFLSAEWRKVKLMNKVLIFSTRRQTGFVKC